MERLRSFLFVAHWRLHDHLKYRSPWVSWFFIAIWAAVPFARWKPWKYLLAAHRYSYNAFAEKKILENIEAIKAYSRRALAPESDADGSTTGEFYKRGIVLKEPTVDGGHVVEKGVLLFKFTNSFTYLHRFFDINRLLKRFYLVLEPSWSGYAQPPILAWLEFDEPIFIQVSEPRDRALLERIDGNLVPLGLGSNNWVDYRVFRPLGGTEKKYDAMLVGDSQLVKRIHIYLHAISRITDPDYKAALVVTEYGGKNGKIRPLADYYGVSDKVDLYGKMSQQELNTLLNQSKVNVLLSLKEGSNRALVEGFMAGTPGLLLSEHVGFNKTYFNDWTGAVVAERELPDALVDMKRNWQRYRPREWAMKHISFDRATEAIASTLHQRAEQEGLQFTKSLFRKVNIPEAAYIDDPDDSKRRQLLEKHLEPFAVGAESQADADPAGAGGGLAANQRAGA